MAARDDGDPTSTSMSNVKPDTADAKEGTNTTVKSAVTAGKDSPRVLYSTSGKDSPRAEVVPSAGAGTGAKPKRGRGGKKAALKKMATTKLLENEDALLKANVEKAKNMAALAKAGRQKQATVTDFLKPGPAPGAGISGTDSSPRTAIGGTATTTTAVPNKSSEEKAAQAMGGGTAAAGTSLPGAAVSSPLVPPAATALTGTRTTGLPAPTAAATTMSSGPNQEESAKATGSALVDRVTFLLEEVRKEQAAQAILAGMGMPPPGLPPKATQVSTEASEWQTVGPGGKTIRPKPGDRIPAQDKRTTPFKTFNQAMAAEKPRTSYTRTDEKKSSYNEEKQRPFSIHINSTQLGWYRTDKCLMCGQSHKMNWDTACKEAKSLTKDQRYQLIASARDLDEKSGGEKKSYFSAGSPPPRRRPDKTRSGPRSGGGPPHLTSSARGAEASEARTGLKRPREATHRSGFTPEAKGPRKSFAAAAASRAVDPTYTAFVRELDGTPLDKSRFNGLRAGYDKAICQLLTQGRLPPIARQFRHTSAVTEVVMDSEEDLKWLRETIGGEFLIEDEEDYVRTKGRTYQAWLPVTLFPSMCDKKQVTRNLLVAYIGSMKMRWGIESLFELKGAPVSKDGKGRLIQLLVGKEAEEILAKNNFIIPFMSCGNLFFREESEVKEEARARRIARAKEQGRLKPSVLDPSPLIDLTGDVENLTTEDRSEQTSDLQTAESHQDWAEEMEAGDKKESDKHTDKIIEKSNDNDDDDDEVMDAECAEFYANADEQEVMDTGTGEVMANPPRTQPVNPDPGAQAVGATK